MSNNKDEITKVLYEAAEKSFTSLFKEHGDEHFYYCTIVMADAAPPCISAQSRESLKAYLEDCECSEADVKWSWADTPYRAYGYKDYFKKVEKMFNEHFHALWDSDDEVFEQEYNDWFDAMETVMVMLKDKGIFNLHNGNAPVFIYAEESPPDDDFMDVYTRRAKRMNLSEVYEEWYNDLMSEN